MGELARARDALREAIEHASEPGGETVVEAAFDTYGEVLRSYWLADLDPEIERIRLATGEAGSPEGRIVLEWVTTILYKDRA